MRHLACISQGRASGLPQPIPLWLGNTTAELVLSRMCVDTYRRWVDYNPFALPLAEPL